MRSQVGGTHAADSYFRMLGAGGRIMLENKADILSFIENDREIIKILTLVRDLDLPDSWLCAGFLRSRIWDYQAQLLHRTPVHDIDVIYFNDRFIDDSYEQKAQSQLKAQEPGYHWEVKNEARMHAHNPDTAPYASSTDAISKFPETATAIGARLDAHNQVILTVPHGVSDLLSMTVRPTPFTREKKKRMMIYNERMKQKNWQNSWPLLKIIARLPGLHELAEKDRKLK